MMDQCMSAESDIGSYFHNISWSEFGLRFGDLSMLLVRLSDGTLFVVKVSTNSTCMYHHIFLQFVWVALRSMQLVLESFKFKVKIVSILFTAMDYV